MKIFLLTFLLSISAWAADSRKPLEPSDAKAVTEVLLKNDELFNAFLKKDPALVQKKAAELHELASKTDSSVLSKVKKKAKSLKGIKPGTKNESNLESYEPFLNALIKVVKKYQVPGRYNIFSCPMVNKSWIQDVTVNKDVRNVYAMEMLECGTQDTKF